MMSLHGISHDAWKRYTKEGSWYYEVLYPGFKYNLTDIAAAIGIEQLKKCDRFWQARERIALIYQHGFADLEEIQLPTCRENAQHAWHLFVIQLNLERLKITRNRIHRSVKRTIDRHLGALHTVASSSLLSRQIRLQAGRLSKCKCGVRSDRVAADLSRHDRIGRRKGYRGCNQYYKGEPTLTKRAFDILVSVAGLIVLLPLLLLVATAIKLDSSGPVFFRQWRVGRKFRRFGIYKFRTMIDDAFDRGLPITVGRDSRITRVGKILRKTKIDELPQLLNVLKGDMSLVGPRPEVPRYVELFRPDYEHILKVRPGLTDLASLKYSDEASILGQSANPEGDYVARLLPDKIRLAKEYIQRSSLLFDVKLIVETIIKLFGHRISS